MSDKKLFLDIVVFGKNHAQLVEALEHAISQLRMGTVSESATYEDGTHVTFDVRDATKGLAKEKYDAYMST